MYRVAVKDHFMIAHSFKGSVFGPAQAMHGATYIVTAEYKRDALDENGIVLDIGLAGELLGKALEPLRYQNLDELSAFRGRNTTTEVLAAHIHSAIAEQVRPHFEGELRIVLEESHVAWASYEAPV